MKIFTPLLFALAWLSCKQPEPVKHTSLKQLNWLVGEWVGDFNGEPFYESWRMVNDSLMLNFQLQVSPIDTSLQENGYIRIDENGLIHGNEKQTWKLDKLTDNEVVFVAPNLPYANRVSWKHSPKDHWIVNIDNPNGKVHYDLQRITWLAPIVEGYMLATDKMQ
jgi:hypothetical protein